MAMKVLLYLSFVLLVLTATAVQGAPRSSSHDQDGWDLVESSYFLMLAYSAYCPSESVQDWNCDPYCGANGTSTWVTHTLLSNETKGTFGYVGYDETLRRIVIIFRGTVNLPNWIEDLESAKHEPCGSWGPSGCLITYGFQDAYMSLQPQVIKAFNELRSSYPDYEIYVTGHSLGASMSTLCAVDLHNLYGIKVNINNFGSPRVGNTIFEEWAVQDVLNISWRNTNKRDIVPHVPPMALNYHHIPTEVWRNLDDEFVVCTAGNGEDPSCSDSLVDLSVYDHLHYFGVPLHCSGGSATSSTSSSSSKSGSSSSSSSSGSSSDSSDSSSSSSSSSEKLRTIKAKQI